MLRNSNILIIAIIVLSFFAGCKKGSDGVLSKSAMTKVLADYYIAQGMASSLMSEDSLKARAYIDAVFRKHGISKADFDSSLVYYSRHAGELRDIYAQLDKQLEKRADELQNANDNEELTAVYQVGDTANIWSGKRAYIFHDSPLLNKYVYSIPCDTSFHQSDNFIFSADVFLISETPDRRDNGITISLSVCYSDGKKSNYSQYLNMSNSTQFTLQTDKGKEIKEIFGSFYYQGVSGTNNLCAVRNISLVRMHTNPTAADSVSTDSVKANPSLLPVDQTQDRPSVAPSRPAEHEERIELQKAPEERVADPNAMTPMRRRRPTAQPSRTPKTLQ